MTRRRLHYDLRLELDGVFKSWAVTKGPRSIRTTSGWRWRSRTTRSTMAISKAPFPKGQYGGGTVQLWDRGYLGVRRRSASGASRRATEVHPGGRASCTAAGCWCACATTATGGKRTNWLLIKHRDEFAKEGEGNDILDEDQSVASGRSMEQIAAGKGKAPKPFMTGEERRGKADAVWHSNRGEAAEARARPRRRRKARAARKTAKAARRSRRCRISSRRSSAARSSARRAATAGCHEIKFDGYRVQLRVEDGEATLKTRKGLDWTDKFAAIAKAGAARCRTA